MASVTKVEQFAQENGGRAGRRPMPRSEATGPRDGMRNETLVDFRRRFTGEQTRSLSALIEGEIIPRLLVAHATPRMPAPLPEAGDAHISAAEVAAFAPLSLQVEADELIAYAEALVARGVPLEALLVDLLAPAARRLGEDWEADRCDFVDVTMGLWRLQEVVHALSDRTWGHRHGLGAARRALFASLAGDQHSFGTVVIEELFAANGWLTDRLSEAPVETLLAQVRDEWFDMVGLTITCDIQIAPLPAVVRAIRAASRNPRLCIMVGGRPFVDDAALAGTVGADGTAPDARVAVRIAGELVDALSQSALSPVTG